MDLRHILKQLNGQWPKYRKLYTVSFQFLIRTFVLLDKLLRWNFFWFLFLVSVVIQFAASKTAQNREQKLYSVVKLTKICIPYLFKERHQNRGIMIVMQLVSMPDQARPLDKILYHTRAHLIQYFQFLSNKVFVFVFFVGILNIQKFYKYRVSQKYWDKL